MYLKNCNVLDKTIIRGYNATHHHHIIIDIANEIYVVKNV